MVAAAPSDPSDSFTFMKEREEIEEKHKVLSIATYEQLLQPWINKFEDVHRKRDIMKELTQRGAINNLRDTMSSLKQQVVGDIKRSKKIESLVQTEKSVFGRCKADIRHSIHEVQYDYVQGGEEAVWKQLAESLVDIDSDEHLEGLVKEMGLLMKMHLDKLLAKILAASDMVSENERYNDWRISHDDNFAKKYLKSVQVDPRLRKHVVQCCAVCKKIVIAHDEPKQVNLGLNELVASAEKCYVCSLILRSFVDTVGENGDIHLLRARAALRTGSGGKRMLRFSAESDFAGRPKRHIPIGRPVSSERDSNARFQLLRAWLHECNHNHHCNRRNSKTIFPTRVLDIGGLEAGNTAPGWVRLANADERKSDAYVALSHCWGRLRDDQKTFCTIQSNLAQRRRGFSVSELPQTFQDAIKVARSLGLRYLWIDSLCIVQSGDDGNDWQREAVKMNNVFSQAYCVIAATAAIDSHSGFLYGGIDGAVEHVCVQDGPDRQFYISTDIDAYDDDVGKAVLNTRAWVMQESVLARRTIHFSTNQIYWECGKGIYCENLTRLKSVSRGKSFVLDPGFPGEVVALESRSDMWNCITFLCEDYSRRHITFDKDRSIAISGLEDRIAEAIFCSTRFSTFERFLHRGLLWCEEVSRVKDIDSVPSWSWLSCSGGIKFIKDGFGEIELNQSLSFHAERREALVADLGAFFNCTISLDRDQCALKLWDAAGSDKGWLRLDTKGAVNVDNLHCIVVGKKLDGRYLVIAVVPNGGQEEYRRFGMSEVGGDCVVKVQDKVCIV